MTVVVHLWNRVGLAVVEIKSACASTRWCLPEIYRLADRVFRNRGRNSTRTVVATELVVKCNTDVLISKVQVDKT